ncbi:MAG: DUF1460 domain-containing protein [Nitrospirae bacterium]|nr:DUF1460 domain-containing protein [Nitrospirota bacterium]
MREGSKGERTRYYTLILERHPAFLRFTVYGGCSLSKAIRSRFNTLSVLLFAVYFSLLLCAASHSFALSDGEIIKFQTKLKDKPIGERIALWAEKFIGVPYDKDPLGEYVSRAVITADERVDCMYLTFRAVELALSATPEEAVNIALDKRFHSKGIIKGGKVINYDNRFEYGEDMIHSDKWGKEITSHIGRVKRTNGSRGKDFIEFLPPDELRIKMNALKSGDIIFFIKDPKKRSQKEEIIAHMGIIKTENKKVYLIHAGGIKGKGGVVKKALFKNYIKKMPFVGAKITRFNEPL